MARHKASQFILPDQHHPLIRHPRRSAQPSAPYLLHHVVRAQQLAPPQVLRVPVVHRQQQPVDRRKSVDDVPQAPEDLVALLLRVAQLREGARNVPHPPRVLAPHKVHHRRVEPVRVVRLQLPPQVDGVQRKVEPHPRRPRHGRVRQELRNAPAERELVVLQRQVPRLAVDVQQHGGGVAVRPRVQLLTPLGKPLVALQAACDDDARLDQVRPDPQAQLGGQHRELRKCGERGCYRRSGRRREPIVKRAELEPEPRVWALLFDLTHARYSSNEGRSNCASQLSRR
ncbi:hypothetical protein AK830_g7113 [Neonectria ditissima]|uniref:Uncharacterized protein n=1 Tax=Neonectria ditissima TaxID=78410 RepID=A0A0P7B0F7_9HYPO|nr:hypothetical protein AK830_g7113 [Neonectria ditissima]